MPKFSLCLLAAALALSPAVAWLAPALDLPAEILSGGQASIADVSQNAYSHPAGVLDAKQAELFALGYKMFSNRWAFFWFENAEFGRGPTSNAQSCASCHVNNGRGLVTGTRRGEDGAVRDHHITVPFASAPNLVVRISVPGEGSNGAPRPHPHMSTETRSE